MINVDEPRNKNTVQYLNRRTPLNRRRHQITSPTADVTIEELQELLYKYKDDENRLKIITSVLNTINLTGNIDKRDIKKGVDLTISNIFQDLRFKHGKDNTPIKTSIRETKILKENLNNLFEEVQSILFPKVSSRS